MVRHQQYILLCFLAILLAACKTTKYVPDGYFLLKKNRIEIKEKNALIDKGEISSILKQPANRRFLGLPVRLWVYNALDSAKAEKSSHRRFLNYRKKNKRRLKRQKRINERRIRRAIKRGDSTYKPKKVRLKDTLDPKPTLINRLKYGYGEAPVIYSPLLMKNSKEQIGLYMEKHGYLHANVEAAVQIDSSKKKAIVTYSITPNDPFIIDSIYVKTDNHEVKNRYELFMQTSKSALHPPFQFNTEKLEEMRQAMARYMGNKKLYGFTEGYISYQVDTLQPGKNTIEVDIAKRYVGEGENKHLKPFETTKIKRVQFHILDTMYYEGNFMAEKLKPKGIKLKPFQAVPTFDTLHYSPTKGKHPDRRKATFLYNGKLFTKPNLIEYRNYLEQGEYYKLKYFNNSYQQLMGMDLFRIVKPYITENKDNSINVDYYLVPKKQQTFSFEPKATHSNSFLGVSSSINYINRNLFRQGWKLTVSLSGGFESQPEIFGKNNTSAVIDKETRSFNTIEFGPSITLDIPNLVPLPLYTLSKRQNPKTTFSLAFNYQDRPDFIRRIFQWNYLWKFRDLNHTQFFTVGIPIIGGIQFVNIDKSPALEQRLKELNDLFLINAYSDQAIYKDLMVSFSFQNPDIKDGKMTFYYGFKFDMAGMIMSAITKNKPVNDNGFKEFLGQRYAQFIRLDNDFRFHQELNEKSSLHYRLQIGGGIPLKNNGLTLPYDYSFFGGGSNNNRGFRAQSLGPGTYKYYLDTNRVTTELGDIRLSASAEYRYKFTKLFEGAAFVDVGNVWTYNNDPNRPGGQISADFYKQLAVSAGIGLRLDFSFLVVRFDLGIPLRVPSLPQGAQWIFQSRTPYIQEGRDKWGINPATGDFYAKDLLPKPFIPQLHIAIGYPF